LPQARESFPGQAPRASSVDPTAEAAVRYVALSVRALGHASEAELNAVKAAGYDYPQLIEIVQHVALNTWTNAINAAFKTEVDFLVIAPRQGRPKTAQRPSKISWRDFDLY
jgi:S-adenosylmethionine synthetase